MGGRSTFHSYMVKTGDVISVREKSKKQTRVSEALQLAQQVGLPAWVEVNLDKVEGVFKKVPDRDEFAADINESSSSNCIPADTDPGSINCANATVSCGGWRVISLTGVTNWGY